MCSIGWCKTGEATNEVQSVSVGGSGIGSNSIGGSGIGSNSIGSSIINDNLDSFFNIIEYNDKNQQIEDEG